MTKVKKILVEIHHGIGDVVQILPLIKNIRKHYKDAKISVIVASKVQADIVKMSELVDEYYYLNLRKMSVKEIVNFVVKIRKEEYDIGFLSPISNHKMGTILLYILGCKKRVGEVSSNDKLLVKHNYPVLERPDLHKVERNLNLLTALDITPSKVKSTLKINESLNCKAEDLLGAFVNGSLIGICVGTNPVERKTKVGIEAVEAKKWPLEKYIELIEQLTLHNFKVVLLGGQKEVKEIEGFLEIIKNNPNVLNLINKTSLTESAAVINFCDLIIGGDTGMLHIADALDKKTLTIFGPTNPRIVGPYSNNANNVSLELPCQYCYSTNALFECTNRICIDNISVEFIFGKIIKIMNKKDDLT